MLLRTLGLLALFTGSAAAQTPAEVVTRGLNQELRADRFIDNAEYARGDPFPARQPVEMFYPERKTLYPTLGRPEENGRVDTGGNRGGLSSMGPNPQR